MSGGRASFRVFLLAGIGAAVSIVSAVVLVQLAYLGDAASPFAELGHGDVRAAVVLSLVTATIAASLAMLVAIPSAYLLARSRSPFAPVLDAVLDVPIILSPVVIGIALILLFRTTGGRFIETHLVRVVFEVPGIVAAQFILALALEVRVLKAAFADVDVRLEQVARVLGCSPWSAFVRVTLPLARHGLLAAFILGWSRALGEFGATVTVAGAVAGKTETIPVAIYMNLAGVQIEKALALSLLLTFMAIGVLLTARLLTARGKA